LINTYYSRIPIYSSSNKQENKSDKLNQTRELLAKRLFQHNNARTNNLSFGWSKGLSAIEVKILDELTNPLLKTAAVTTHYKADGDAIGSSIGVSELLKRVGVKVYSFISGDVSARFNNFPLIEKCIKKPAGVVSLWTQNNVQNIDLAVITDSSTPERLGKDSLDLISKVKKAIIIDHHDDMPGTLSNEEQWKKRLKELNPSLTDENILYSTISKSRSSASEMVAELDKEVLEESKIQPPRLNNYNPCYYSSYRLGLAAGINTDTRKLQLLTPEMGNTKNVYNWLLETAPRNLNIKRVLQSGIPREVYNKTNSLMLGKTKLKGVEVNIASKKNPVGYIYIKDKTSLEEMAKNHKCIFEDIYTAMKANVYNSLKDVYIIAVKNEETKETVLSIRSTNSLASKIADEFNKRKLGSGGGHPDASGYTLKPDVNFKAVQKIIKKVIKKEKPSMPKTPFIQKIKEFLLNIKRKFFQN